MVDQGFAAAWEVYSSQIQGQMHEISRNMCNSEYKCLTEQVDYHKLDDFKAIFDQRGQFQVGGSWTMAMNRPLGDLEQDLSAAVRAVVDYKRDMQDIIAFAGDISEGKISDLHEIIDKTARKQTFIPNPSQNNGQLAALAVRSDFNLSSDCHHTPSQSLFSMHIQRMSDQELKTQIELQFNRQLLALYQFTFAKQESEHDIFTFKAKDTESGLPFIVQTSSGYTERGCYQVTNGQKVIEKFKMDSRNRSFTGRKVNGHIVSGKGAFHMCGGERFQGRVVDETLAEGKMIDGERSKEGQFRLKREGNAWSFTLFGSVKCFRKRVLYEEVKSGDGSWKGWSQWGNKKFTGEWRSTGSFTGVIEAPPMRWAGRFGSEGLEGKGQLTNGSSTYKGRFERGKPHGTGVSTNGRERLIGEWQGGELVSAASHYEGNFLNGCYHGWGTLKESDFCYKGYFSGGRYKGIGTYATKKFAIVGTFQAGQPHGLCLYTSQEIVYMGYYKQGKMHGKGWVQCPTFTYAGDYVRGHWQGLGEYMSQQCSYTGQFKAGEFEGYGKLKLQDADYIGKFANGKFNGSGSLVYRDGTTKTGFFRDNRLT